jgi:hypothetical protein
MTDENEVMKIAATLSVVNARRCTAQTGGWEYEQP